jgi:triosephosphate isomerase (TIM)
LIAGNWKCNGTLAENEERVKVFNEAGPIPENVDVALCVPFIHIPMVLANVRSDITVGAQNCGSNDGDGAFTGEVAAHQIKDIGCTWVIIGHSERREGFGMPGETEDLCAEKTKVAIKNGLKVMFCIGEKKEERETGVTMEVCAKQLEPLTKAVEAKDWESIAIAYEPGESKRAVVYFFAIISIVSIFSICTISTLCQTNLLFRSLGDWNWTDSNSGNGPRNSQGYPHLDFGKCFP